MEKSVSNDSKMSSITMTVAQVVKLLSSKNKALSLIPNTFPQNVKYYKLVFNMYINVVYVFNFVKQTSNKKLYYIPIMII
jgi:hypothetical protein